MASLRVLAFNHERRPVQFDTWLDDLQLYLLSDIKDSVSIFDHVSGATTAPPATADSATRSQTAQVLYDAVVARYSSPATAALGRLLLPYLFPELSAFATVEDLVSHLRASDARYRAAALVEFLDRNQPSMFITLYFIVTRLPDSLRSVWDDFLSLDPTSHTVDLLEQHLLAVETSAVAMSLFLRTLGLLLLVQSAAASRARVAGVVEVAAVVEEVAAGVVVGATVGLVPAVGLVAHCLVFTSLRSLRTWVESVHTRYRASSGSCVCSGVRVRSGSHLLLVSPPDAPDSSVAPPPRSPLPAPHWLSHGGRSYLYDPCGCSPFSVAVCGPVSCASTQHLAPCLLAHTAFDGEGWRCDGVPGLSYRAFVCVTSADKLSACAIPCVFLGLVPDAPGWQFYHPTSRHVFPSQDVTFDESLPFYRLFPYRSAPLSPPPLFLAPDPPPVDPLPPQGPAPSGVSPILPCTHTMTIRPSSVPLRVPLLAPPESSLFEVPDPGSDRACAAYPTVSRLLATAVTDPSFDSTAASALVAELLDFAAACRLYYATALVVESRSASRPSIEGECALGTDVLEDRQEDFECLATAVPRFTSMLLAPEGDPDAPDIPTPRSYAEENTGPYSSRWLAAMDAEMASWKSTGNYIDEVSPPGANIVDRMWIFRGVDYFQTFSPTPKMTTLRVLLPVAAQHDYELHSLDFITAFLQGSQHEEIRLRRPPGFTESFPEGTQWSLRRPVYGLRQAPHEWHDTLSTTLAALGFAPATADPSLFLRTDTSLPPFYVLVYVDDLVFATADIEALTLVKSELQNRHTCTDLGELRSYIGLQITRDRARRTITLTQSHMVHQSVEPSGPYPELLGCLKYLMTCTRPDLAYPLSLLARYVAPVRQAWGSCLEEGVQLSSPVTQTLPGSSCEAEIYDGAMASQELCWLTYLLTDLGEQPRLPPVLTKHIALRYFLARELQQRGQLRLAYMATRANTADIFTKALPPGDHQRFSTMLGLLVLLFFTGLFDTWLDDLQLYLLSDSRDSVSLFDHTSGAAPAPPATADNATRSQTAQVLYDAVVARYSSPSTAALGRLLLPYLFPELSAFAIVEDLVSHLRTSDARYRAPLLAKFLAKNPPPMYINLYFIVTRLPNSLRSVRDHYLALDPTALTVDLLEQHLFAVETSVVDVGAACGTPRTPFFEGCSPSPLAPSYTSTATANVLGAVDVRAASASAKRRRSKGKGGRGSGGGSGGGGGGSCGGGGGSGGGGSSGTSGGSGGFGGGGGGSGGSGGSGSGGVGGGRTGAPRDGFGGGQRQQQQRRSETPSPQQLREWFSQRGASGGSVSWPYVIRTGDRAGQTCGKLHTQHRCFSRLDDTWRAEFGDEAERPRWAELLRTGVAIFDLDFDAILAAMYALSPGAEGDCYLCVPPDPSIEAAALGASECVLLGTAPAQALHTFTIDSGASHCFFRDNTTLTPLAAHVPVRLADPSKGLVLARSSTVLPCPAVQSETPETAETEPVPSAPGSLVPSAPQVAPEPAAPPAALAAVAPPVAPAPAAPPAAPAPAVPPSAPAPAAPPAAPAPAAPPAAPAPAAPPAAPAPAAPPAAPAPAAPPAPVVPPDAPVAPPAALAAPPAAATSRQRREHHSRSCCGERGSPHDETPRAPPDSARTRSARLDAAPPESASPDSTRSGSAPPVPAPPVRATAGSAPLAAPEWTATSTGLARREAKEDTGNGTGGLLVR
ncbi:unnamed protein product [Closterium sp. NIES-53]